jgi:hypothetical protein
VAVLSISSITSSNHSYLPTLPVQAETNARPDSENRQDPVQLSDRAKQLLAAPIQPEKSEVKDESGKESVQISSSIGRLSRVTGLQREEVAALYRSIDQLT